LPGFDSEAAIPKRLLAAFAAPSQNRRIPDRLEIAIDATYSIGSHLSGVGVYSRELLSGLAVAHPEARFQFCYRPHRYFRSYAEKLPANARRRLLAEPIGPRSAALFHGLNQRLPRIPLRRSVATFHDLFVLTGEYSTPEFRARFAAQAQDAAERADAIIAVSSFTAHQVINLLDVSPMKVRVVHHGVRALRYPEIPREKVILNVGAVQTRKNLRRLVKAFESVDPDWRLVLAGSAGYGAAAIEARIARSRARDRIQLLGYISADQLAAWYARAMIFAFPSLDEGFGMPALEAMAAGVPVIAANRSALPEIVGNAAMLVDPTDDEELQNVLKDLTTNRELRESLVRRGTLRARLFTWDNAARDTWKVYEDLLG
jgi:glycosyltransferase involved in cell wall biosynthesis